MVIATVKVVCNVLSAPTPPTRRMSAKNAHLRRAKRKRTSEAPLRMYQARIAAISAVVATTATPPPATPSAGIGPKPKMNSGDSGISRATPMQMTIDGKSILPVPRMTLASAFMSHTRMLPAKTTFEYCIAASSEPPLPPIAA